MYPRIVRVLDTPNGIRVFVEALWESHIDPTFEEMIAIGFELTKNNDSPYPINKHTWVCWFDDGPKRNRGEIHLKFSHSTPEQDAYVDPVAIERVLIGLIDAFDRKEARRESRTDD